MSDTKTKSSEQGLKRRKVIRTVKKGIVDNEVLNELQKCLYYWWIFKKIYILFFRLDFLSFHVFMFFWYGKHDISKSFYRNYMIFFKVFPVHFLSLASPMWNYDSWTVYCHHHFLLFSDFWKYFLIISIYNWIWMGSTSQEGLQHIAKGFNSIELYT